MIVLVGRYPFEWPFASRIDVVLGCTWKEQEAFLLLRGPLLQDDETAMSSKAGPFFTTVRQEGLQRLVEYRVSGKRFQALEDGTVLHGLVNVGNDLDDPPL